MPDHHPDNERIKRAYLDYLANAGGRSKLTVAAAARAIRSYELFTGFKCFKTFTVKQASGYRAHLASRPGKGNGEPLSIHTQNTILTSLRGFFAWLAGQPTYRSAIIGSDVEYLSINRHDQAIVRRRPLPKQFPSCEQVVQVLRLHPTADDLDLRDRAVIAFLLLTCARVGAIIGLKLKHIDLEADNVFMDAADVATKRSKTIAIWFYPVDPMARAIFAAWVDRLRALGFGDDDPLFPATAQTVGANLQFTNAGLSHDHWQGTDAIRAIVKKRLTAAGQPYFHPHLFRKTIVQLGQRLCQTPEHFKAWSQNMGHDEVLTTWLGYGEVSAPRQAELIRQLGRAESEHDERAMLRKVLQEMLAKLDSE